MSKYSEYEPSVRCMGMTRDKKRCARDATYDLGGRCYCNTHYRNALLANAKERQNAKKTVG